MNIYHNLAIEGQKLLVSYSHRNITINYLVSELYKIVDVITKTDKCLAENLQTEINGLDFIIAVNYDDNRNQFTETQNKDIDKIIKVIAQFFAKLIVECYSIIKFILLDQRCSLNKTTHYVDDEVVESIKELQIVQYYNDTGFYLFYLNANNSEVITDTYHETIKDALKQAAWEFGIQEDEWSEY